MAFEAAFCTSCREKIGALLMTARRLSLSARVLFEICSHPGTKDRFA